MTDGERDGLAPAIGSEGVRSALRRHLLSAIAVLFVGLILVAVFVAWSVRSESESDSLERDGIAVDGRVVGFDSNAGISIGAVDVEFWFENARRRERVFLTDNSPRYAIDEPVTMLIDPTNAERFTILGETNQPPAVVWPMIFALVVGAVGLLSGGMAIHQNLRQRRILSASSWRTLTMEYRDAPASRGLIARPLVRIADGRTDQILRLVDTSRRRIRTSGLSALARVEVASDPKGRYVLRPSGSDATFLARTPRKARHQREWSDAFDG